MWKKWVVDTDQFGKKGIKPGLLLFLGFLSEATEYTLLTEDMVE